jgi:O-antigen/teichoic acid export membrane protein
MEYSIGSALGLVGSILRVTMAARLLSAEQRGLWLALQLVFGYAQNLHLGVLFGMLRSVPMLGAAGDTQGAESAKRTSLGFTALMTALGWLGLAGFVLALEPHQRRYYLLIGVLTTTTLAKSYLVTLFKAESRFRELSVSLAIGGATSIATVTLIAVAALDGLIWGMILQTIIEMAWLLQRGVSFRFAIDRKMLASLLSVGAVTLLVSLGSTLLTSVDRTVMLTRLGQVQTGYYYVGTNVIALLPTLAGFGRDVLTPRFFEAYGASARPASLIPLVERPLQAGAVLLAAGLGMMVLAMPPTVAHLLPNLVSGNDAARIALLATYPLVLAGFVTNVFYALNRQVLHVLLIAAAAGLGCASATFAVSIRPEIASAAWGGALGLFAYYVLTVLAGYAVMVRRVTPGLRALFATAKPAALALAVVFLCDRVGARYRPEGSVVRALAAEAVFVACFAPWILRTVRDVRNPSRA